GLDSCPIRNVLARFSGKWSMLILCVLAENPATRFNEIGKAIPDLSPKVLSDTLKNLERDGLISRHLYAEIPPRVEYSLTPLGKTLMPHLENLIGWAIDNFDAIPRGE
ncbi:MAG: helix-turn-helix transcriptional regulator, partial [Muribaculaceae bacterium]|nr:helix-turn-helix transcriptional regulator [Muribaculaceae bacterium]